VGRHGNRERKCHYNGRLRLQEPEHTPRCVVAPLQKHVAIAWIIDRAAIASADMNCICTLADQTNLVGTRCRATSFSFLTRGGQTMVMETRAGTEN
jgi:hypothetical protein